VGGCCTSSGKSKSKSAQGAPPPPPAQKQVTTASSRPVTTNQTEIQLHKEEIVVGKKNVSNGGILIRTTVQTENVSQPVELRREEFSIERIPAGQATASQADNADTAFTGREYFIPLMREEPVTSTRAVVSEKIEVGKRMETDRKTVSAPIRAEDIEVTKVNGTKPAASGGQQSESARAGTAAPVTGNSLNLVREELVVGKTPAEGSGVKVQKIVRTQTASQPVELARENYTIDRTPGSGQPATDADFSPRELRIDLSREEPVISTRVAPSEVVRVNKVIQTDTETVKGTVRKQNIEIVKTGNYQGAAVGGTSASGQSGASTLSGGSEKQMTITGKAVCAKCQLHETAECKSVIQARNSSGKLVNYYLTDNDVTKNFHDQMCKESKVVTAKGTVNGTTFTPTQIALAK
jgi:uncharacterized protein (TIGR02271 family)